MSKELTENSKKASNANNVSSERKAFEQSATKVADSYLKLGKQVLQFAGKVGDFALPYFILASTFMVIVGLLKGGKLTVEGATKYMEYALGKRKEYQQRLQSQQQNKEEDAAVVSAREKTNDETVSDTKNQEEIQREEENYADEAEQGDAFNPEPTMNASDKKESEKTEESTLGQGDVSPPTPEPTMNASSEETEDISLGHSQLIAVDSAQSLESQGDNIALSDNLFPNAVDSARQTVNREEIAEQHYDDLQAIKESEKESESEEDIFKDVAEWFEVDDESSLTSGMSGDSPGAAPIPSPGGGS